MSKVPGISEHSVSIGHVPLLPDSYYSLSLSSSAMVPEPWVGEVEYRSPIQRCALCFLSTTFLFEEISWAVLTPDTREKTKEESI